MPIILNIQKYMQDYSNVIDIIYLLKDDKYIDNYLKLFQKKINKQFPNQLDFNKDFLITILSQFSENTGKGSWPNDWILYCCNLDVNYIKDYLSDFDEKNQNYVSLFLIRYLYCIPFIANIINVSHCFDNEGYYNDFLYTEDELKEQQEYHKNNQKKLSQYKCAGNMDITSYYYQHGINTLPKEVRKYIRHKDFFDIGAFTGDSAVVLNTFFPNKIYSFEPMTELYNILLKTIEMNKLDGKIIPVNKGLGGKTETKVLGINEWNMVCNAELAKKHIEFLVIKTDEFCYSANCQPALLKLDVEGSEYSIIVEGAEELIKEFEPVLLISVYHTPKDFFEIKDALKKWGIGYTFEMEQHNPFRPNIETILKCYKIK